MPRFHGRREPYTDIGIRRLNCMVAGCDEKATASWTACANGNRHVPICQRHDIELNRLALEFVGIPSVGELLDAYEGAG